MDEAERTRLSKRMSLVLRHRPDSVGLSLGSGGWVDLGDLVAALDRQGGPVTADDVRLVVETSDKRRFALADGRIRAHQGHSVEVDLDLPAAEPPDVLWHGTHEQALPAIRREGLRRMRRHHVHLSAVPDTARRVGARRGDRSCSRSRPEGCTGTATSSGSATTGCGSWTRSRRPTCGSRTDRQAMEAAGRPRPHAVGGRPRHCLSGRPLRRPGPPVAAAGRPPGPHEWRASPR